jgi:predicted peptidase
MRTWTSSAGIAVEAEFVKADNGRVLLRGPDGKTMNTSLNSLSKEDQACTEKLYKESQEKAAAAKREAEENAAGEKEERRAAALAQWQPGKVVSGVTTGETKTTYLVYLPTSFDPENLPPLLYTFSPGGHGKDAMKHVQQPAEKAGWIVVACDKLKNGMDEPTEQKIEDDIFACVPKAVPHDPRHVYLSGMSGGAMRSYQIAARRQDIPFAGILAFGGWLGVKDHHEKYSFSMRGGAVAMINGDNDKNANVWVKPDSSILNEFNWTVKAFYFPGGHTYPPPQTIDEAIAWIQRQPLPK